jgi:hypothetical protein
MTGDRVRLNRQIKQAEDLTEAERDTLTGRWLDQLLSLDEEQHIEGSYVIPPEASDNGRAQVCAVGAWAFVDMIDILGVHGSELDTAWFANEVWGEAKASQIVRANDDEHLTFREIAERYKAGEFVDEYPPEDAADIRNCECPACQATQRDLDGQKAAAASEAIGMSPWNNPEPF